MNNIMNASARTHHLRCSFFTTRRTVSVSSRAHFPTPAPPHRREQKSPTPRVFPCNYFSTHLLLFPGNNGRCRYTDKYIFSTFERNAFCVTADYAFNDVGTINVFNSQRLYSVTGEFANITGTAAPTDEPGQYGVKFDVQPDAVPPAPYWVVALGPINDSNMYDYAIVTDNKDLGLYVLARDPNTFNAMYDNEVLGFLAGAGFNGTLNSPLPTVQAGCTYPVSPSV